MVKTLYLCLMVKMTSRFLDLFGRIKLYSRNLTNILLLKEEGNAISKKPRENHTRLTHTSKLEMFYHPHSYNLSLEKL
jgi:hypothetical protein